MKLISAFFRLIRWPNLVFIALTQFLFYYCIITPSLPESYFQQSRSLSPPVFYLLVLASVLIAAAGYIINDYFDIGIDAINKPERVTIEKIFKRRTIITWHILLNVIALMMAGYIAYHFVRHQRHQEKRR